MRKNQHVGSDALDFLNSIIPHTPEMYRIEKQERFRIALTEAMRNLRNCIGITQQELAKRLEVGQSWISKLESANNDHTFESVLAYLDALDADFQVSLLLRGEQFAVISANASSFKELAHEHETCQRNLSQSLATNPEFSLISAEERNQCSQVQSLVKDVGIWGAYKGGLVA
jgi:transcriptional regulator with XRE-family HTH domain